jgi:hypothetical protein
MAYFDPDFLNHRFRRWDQLPDIELYMDQVIGFLEKELRPVLRDNKLITPSMINNYVKLGVIPRPSHKRYGREHLALLVMTCVLKQVVPLPVAGALLPAFEAPDGLAAGYDRFCDTVERALRETCARAEGDAAFAGEIALEAAARRLCVGELVAKSEEKLEGKE